MFGNMSKESCLEDEEQDEEDELEDCDRPGTVYGI